jgi:hypothetical protein
MGRQFRPPRSKGNEGDGGSFREFVGPVPGTSVATNSLSHVNMIPSYGVTDISTWAASTYFRAPPTQGCIKTLVSASTAPAVRYICVSSSGNTVTINNNGAQTTANTHLQCGATTMDACITLMGVNSTHWVVVSVYPTTASGSWDIRTT